MKKVLIVFDGEHFSRAAFDFACRLNEQQPVLLTGVFLPSVDYMDMMIYYLGGFDAPLYYPAADTGTENIGATIAQFRASCEKHHIEHRVHEQIAGAIVEVIRKETRYSDLLLLSSDLFYSNLSKGAQKEYLNDTLHGAECPVVLLPEQYDFPQSLILAYDGSESSVFAIKQFAYLFPWLSLLDTTVVYVSGKEKELPDAGYIQEFAVRHFPTLSFSKLEAGSRKFFESWIAGLQAPLLVAGSFGRSAFSELFRRSFIRDVVEARRLPVFVAHK